MKNIYIVVVLLCCAITISQRSFASGIDSSTVLLIKSNSFDLDNSFVDSSYNNHNVVPYGNIHHSTTSKYFGTTSIYFDGSGDYLSIPNSDDWNLGNSDFTIDFWAYNANTSLGEGAQSVGIIARRDGPYWQAFTILKDDGTMKFRASADGATWGLTLNMGTFDASWHHYAVVRNGNNFNTYKDGIVQDSKTSSITLMNQTNSMAVGKYQVDLNGYIDELRISKGIPRWTGNFTPPLAPYTTCIADYNNDGIIDGNDLIEKQRDVLFELQEWTKCWKNGTACQ